MVTLKPEKCSALFLTKLKFSLDLHDYYFDARQRELRRLSHRTTLLGLFGIASFAHARVPRLSKGPLAATQASISKLQAENDTTSTRSAAGIPQPNRLQCVAETNATVRRFLLWEGEKRSGRIRASKALRKIIGSVFESALDSKQIARRLARGNGSHSLPRDGYLYGVARQRRQDDPSRRKGAGSDEKAYRELVLRSPTPLLDQSI